MINQNDKTNEPITQEVAPTLESIQPMRKSDRTLIALVVAVSVLAGFIGGFFVGETRGTSLNLVTSPVSGNETIVAETTTAPEEDPYAGDYTQYVINAEKGITIDNFYSDNETKFVASQLIGKTLPEIKWTDSEGIEHSTTEYADEKYILEFFLPTCTYCNAAISEVDSFREAGNKVLSLAFASGDISAFNATTENAFIINNMNDGAVTSFTDLVAWVPSFIYIENNTVKLVIFGSIDQSSLESSNDVAFSS